MLHSVADRACPVTEGMKHGPELRDGFLQGVVSRSTAKMLDDVFIQDHALLRAPTLVEAAGQRFRVKAVVVATGSTPILPAPGYRLCSTTVWQRTLRVDPA